MPFSLVPSPRFSKSVEKLDRSVVIELEKKLLKLKENPVSNEHRMHHSDNYFRIYIRNMRLVYKVEENSVILIDLINREEGYEKFRS